MAGTTQTNERYLLPAGTLPSDISQPEPPPVVAERSVEVTVRVHVWQEYKSRDNAHAIELAKRDLTAALMEAAPEITVVMFVDEEVTSVRERTY